MSDKETHAPTVCYSLLLERHCYLVSDIATPAAAVCNRDLLTPKAGEGGAT